MTVEMTILGLGRTGASFGLALKPYAVELVRTGHDRELRRAQKAQKLGALDKTSINLPASVEKADVVVLALPLDEVRSTLEIIGPVLKEGCVLLDLTSNKVAVGEWVKQLLPPDRYYVTMSPSFNPARLYDPMENADEPDADLFRGGITSITSPRGTHTDAIKMATDLTHLLGAKPYFADPYEVDGLLAASDLLPKLVAAAVTNSITSNPSWREGRKLAGRSFAEATQPLLSLDEAEEYGLSELLNHENVIRSIDQMVDVLLDARDAIKRQDQAYLKDYFERARAARETWLKERKEGLFDEVPSEKPDVPTSGEMIGRMFGIRRRPKDKK